MCIARFTANSHIQHFADGRHRFYVEQRCRLNCIENSSYCTRCQERPTTASHRQHVRTFHHGDVTGPVPDHSHMYGGSWYEAGCKKWGIPNAAVLQLAVDFQQKAREGLLHSMSAPVVMPFVAPVVAPVAAPVVAPVIAPVVAPVVAPVAEALVVAEKKPRLKRPTVVAPVTAPVVPPIPIEPPKPKQKPVPKKKEKKPDPYATVPTVIGEVAPVVPTHLEQTVEELNTEDYEIEYVPLSLIEIKSTMYYRDAIKNKLYQQIKEKQVGRYVGRYHIDSETIYTDVPDSDDEE